MSPGSTVDFDKSMTCASAGMATLSPTASMRLSRMRMVWLCRGASARPSINVPALMATTVARSAVVIIREEYNARPMKFGPETRALAHQVVDALFDHVEQIESRPVVRWRTAEELRAGLGGATPMDCVRQLLDNAIQLHHPSYMGH